MKTDVNKILEICKANNVNLHKSYNEDLFETVEGNSHTENIVVADIILKVAEVRLSNDVKVFNGADRREVYGFIDDDWWDLCQDFRPIAQLFAQVNDIAVIEWDGNLDSCISDFIDYKITTETLKV